MTRDPHILRKISGLQADEIDAFAAELKILNPVDAADGDVIRALHKRRTGLRDAQGRATGPQRGFPVSDNPKRETGLSRPAPRR